MSDRVHKTLLACDGLNRTGQQAPANRDEQCISEFLKLTMSQKMEVIQLARSFLAKNASLL